MSYALCYFFVLRFLFFFKQLLRFMFREGAHNNSACVYRLTNYTVLLMMGNHVPHRILLVKNEIIKIYSIFYLSLLVVLLNHYCFNAFVANIYNVLWQSPERDC